MLLGFSDSDLSVQFSGTIDWQLGGTDTFYIYDSFLETGYFYIAGVSTSFYYDSLTSSLNSDRAFITKRTTTDNFGTGSCEAFETLASPYFDGTILWTTFTPTALGSLVSLTDSSATVTATEVVGTAGLVSFFYVDLYV